MIAMAVYLNRKKLTVAGADDLCVLNAIVNAVGKLGKSTAQISKRRKADLWLSVGGLTRRSSGAEDEHLRWIGHKRLRIGDKITVRLVRTDRPNKRESATVAARSAAKQRRLRVPIKGSTKRRPTARKTSRR